MKLAINFMQAKEDVQLTSWLTNQIRTILRNILIIQLLYFFMPSDLKMFQEESDFSRRLRRYLVKYGLPIISNSIEDYQGQFEEAARLLEITVENMLFPLQEPFRSVPMLKSVYSWYKHYYQAQKECDGKERFLVYTDLEEKINFDPNADTMYAFLFPLLAYSMNTVVKNKRISERSLVKLSQCFIDLDKLVSKVYINCPTTVPRKPFTNHDRLSFKVVQKVDKPVNCCPSSHVAYSILLYNVLERVLAIKEEELMEAVELTAKRMPYTILAGKQHACPDVSFGVIAAQKVFNENFPSKGFDGFVESFVGLPEEHLAQIMKIYEECQKDQGSLDKSVLGYLKRENYPKVSSGYDNYYFDRKTKRLVSLA